MNSNTPEFLGLHHASVLVADLGAALAFYRDTLGLAPDPGRPEMDYDGAWLRLGGGGQQLHLLVLPNPDPVAGRPGHVGRDRHTCLAVSDVAALTARLEAAGIGYTHSKSGRRAVFCRDPDGNGLEFVEAPGPVGKA